jgi:AraC-like DNA-binding protein
MAMWVMAVVGAAPCQCFSPGGNQTTSPGRISSIGPPQRCTRPEPAVTTNAIYPHGAEHETERAQAYREELAERITQAVRQDGRVEVLKGLYLNRSSTSTNPLHGVSEPSFCVIAQGSKEVLLGESVYRYDAAHLNRLRHLMLLGGQSESIAAAIERLRREFNQPLRIESIAREAGMSVSGFHHQFKAVTAMSPLQFQKQLRLQEARRLMLGERMDAASAGYRVGYEDASQFSREYKRLFGQPPGTRAAGGRDVERLRAAVRSEAPGLAP